MRVRSTTPLDPIAHRHQLIGGRPPPPWTGAFVLRQTPPLFGLGLVERIDEAAIRQGADPDDLNGDGIRGRVSVLSDGRLGRFGWKADVPTLVDFSRDALSAEMGVTVPPSATSSFGQSTDEDGVADPEASNEDIESLAFFMAMLPPPPSVDMPEGSVVFLDVGCAACHTPSMPMREGGTVTVFSDLLLHQVSDADDEAFRTPPLWGLSSSAPYMHDGQATSIESAIARHGGEARSARDSVEALTVADRALLLAYLENR